MTKPFNLVVSEVYSHAVHRNRHPRGMYCREVAMCSTAPWSRPFRSLRRWPCPIISDWELEILNLSHVVIAIFFFSQIQSSLQKNTGGEVCVLLKIHLFPHYLQDEMKMPQPAGSFPGCRARASWACGHAPAMLCPSCAGSVPPPLSRVDRVPPQHHRTEALPLTHVKGASRASRNSLGPSQGA